MILFALENTCGQLFRIWHSSFKERKVYEQFTQADKWFCRLENDECIGNEDLLWTFLSNWIF